MLLVAIVIYLFVGVLAGLISGLFGVGGGVIMVPALYTLFYLFGYPQAYLMHLAIGTSLATMIFSSYASMRAHRHKKHILWDLIKKMFPGIALGSVIGALLASSLSGVLLQILFGLFLFTIGVVFLKHKTPHLHEHKLPRAPILVLLGAAVGTIANILGIGGGTLTVPLFTAFKITPKLAIGTSAALSFIMTVLGTLSYMFLNWETIPVPGTIGFIDLTAFLSAGIAASLAAPYGAKLTLHIPDTILKKLFGALLCVIGLSMVF